MNTSNQLIKEFDELLTKIETERNHEDFQKLIIILKSKEMKDVIQKFMNYDNKKLRKKILEEKDLIKLILHGCNMIYNYSGEETGLSDSEYDYLVESYRDITGEDILTEKIINSDNDIVHHKYKSLRGTLDKIYKLTDDDVIKNKSQKSIDDWVKRCEKKIYEKTGDEIDLYDLNVTIMPKFDGVSCVFQCDKHGNLIKALTRGDTSRNEATDITHIFKDHFKGPFTDSEYEYGLKTEIMMKDEYLEVINKGLAKPYKNTRSIVSSIINSNERDENAKYLTIVPLRYSYFINGKESEQEIAPGMFSYPYLKCKLKELEKIRDFAFKHSTVNPGLRCDGAVIYIEDKSIQEILGRENERQKFEVAFKYTEEVAYSKLIDIEFTTGLFGRLNPVAIFKPVVMKLNKIEKASLGSYKRFKDLHLAQGDTIKILYDIIPYVIFDESDPKCKRSDNNEIEAPYVCPDCGEELITDTESGSLLYCKNPKCPCRIKGKILNFIQKIGMKDISYATVNDLYELGLLTNIKDLFKLNKHIKDLEKIPGYGEKKIANILNQIDVIRNTKLSASLVLGSIGIEGISTKTFQKIFEYISLEELLDIALSGNEEFFTVIPGIKELTASKIVRGLEENEKLIDYLMENLLIVNDEKTKGKFKVVFTKVSRDNPEINKLIKDHGGVISESLTKDVSFLVVPVLGITSSKVTKAKKYDIPIVPIDEVEKYINETF